MRFHGGYNFRISGKPEGSLKEAPFPNVLYMPLKNQSFNYSSICVNHEQQVSLGDVLAKDPDNYDVPLLSSCSGKVNLKKAKGYITIEELSTKDGKQYTYHDDLEHIHKKMGPAGLKRYKLLNLGAWEFIKDAYTGKIPDPISKPQGIIVSTVRFEPFLVKGDVLLREYMLQFTRGLEHLQSLLEYQPIYLVLPKLRNDLAVKIKNQIRGYAWVKIVEIPFKYPYDNFEILARYLSLKKSMGAVWGLNVEGVLAIDNALTASRPCIERFISIGGPGAKESLFLRLMAGYPLEKIIGEYGQENSIAINGGILTGKVLENGSLGLPPHCSGITFVPQHREREFLGFIRPGFDRTSYSASFFSSLCSSFPERITNALRGELRPCVSCNFCEEVCPAGIIPHRLHKLIYQDHIDEIERSRIDLCVECGLCSYVCPSKIELMNQFKQTKQIISKEKQEAALKAEKEKAAELEAEARSK